MNASDDVSKQQNEVAARLKAWGVTGPHKRSMERFRDLLGKLASGERGETDRAVADVRRALGDPWALREETPPVFDEDAADDPRHAALAANLESFWWMVGSANALPYDVLSRLMALHLRELREPTETFASEATRLIESGVADADRLLEEAARALDAAVAEADVEAGDGPPGRFELWRLRRGRSGSLKAWNRANKAWGAYVETCANVGPLHDALSRLQADVDAAEQLVTEEIATAVVDGVEKPLATAVTDCDGALATARLAFEESASDFEDLSERLEQLESDLAGKLSAGPVAALRNPDMLGLDRANALVDQIASGYGDLPERCEVFTEPPASWPSEKPPKLDDLDVPVRSLATSHARGELRAAVRALVSGLATTLEGARRRAEAARRALAFSIESAIAELDENAGDRPDADVTRTASDFAFSGIERGRNRLVELRDETSARREKLVSTLVEALSDVRRSAAEDFAADKGIELRLRLLRRQARVAAGGYVVSGGSWTARARGRAVAGFGQVRDFCRRSLARVPWIGSGARDLDIEASIDEADRFESAVETLPAIYRRLFKLQPLEVDDFLVGRDDAFETMARALNRFRDEKPSRVAVVGETGSGKSSFLNCAVSLLLTDETVLRCAFPRTVHSEERLSGYLAEAFGFEAGLKTVAELEARIRELPARHCVVLEVGQQLFMRRVGGFDAIRALLLLMTRTTDRVFWILSMSEYAWAFLGRVVGISDYFPYQVETRSMTQADIETAVMTRHDASGYALRFLEGADLSKRVDKALRKAADESEKQAILRKRYFEDLQRASRGNVQIALYLWVRSVRSTGDVLEVEPVPSLSFEFVSDLSLPKMTALAAILQHGSLSPAEHAEIFNTGVRSSVLLFESMEDQSLIRTTGDEGERSADTVFMVAEMTRRAIVEQLRSRNLFH